MQINQRNLIFALLKVPQIKLIFFFIRNQYRTETSAKSNTQKLHANKQHEVFCGEGSKEEEISDSEWISTDHGEEDRE